MYILLWYVFTLHFLHHLPYVNVNNLTYCQCFSDRAVSDQNVRLRWMTFVSPSVVCLSKKCETVKCNMPQCFSLKRPELLLLGCIVLAWNRDKSESSFNFLCQTTSSYPHPFESDFQPAEILGNGRGFLP